MRMQRARKEREIWQHNGAQDLLLATSRAAKGALLSWAGLSALEAVVPDVDVEDRVLVLARAVNGGKSITAGGVPGLAGDVVSAARSRCHC